MPCHRPLNGYFARKLNETGKRSVVFSLADGYADRPVTLPCGGCLGCRLERARQWAVRCMHEAKLHKHNAFVTLTYDDKSVPWRSDKMTLEPRDFVLFMYRLRKAKGPGVRFFQCGEYGETTLRPHHHALFFNCEFPDRVRCGRSGKNGEPLYSSAELERLWSYGRCWIGEVTFESAGYIARYTMKKLVKSMELDGREPEYGTMSRRPGIGKDWAMKYLADYYPSDEVVVNGVSTRVPRFYDGILEKTYRGQMLRIKAQRKADGKEANEKRIDAGVSHYAKGVILESKIQLLKRDKL